MVNWSLPRLKKVTDKDMFKKYIASSETDVRISKGLRLEFKQTLREANRSVIWVEKRVIESEKMVKELKKIYKTNFNENYVKPSN